MATNEHINKIIYDSRTLIDLTTDTVTADKLLTGATAHDKSGAIITGTCAFDADTSDANAAASEILDGKTAYVGGAKIVGTMPNKEAVKGTISDVDTPYKIPMGFHDGSGTVEIDEVEKGKLTAENIKQGVEILGVTGTYGGEPDKVQSKDATPKATEQTITPDEGFDYLSQVKVLAIPYSEVDNAQGGKTVTIG